MNACDLVIKGIKCDASGCDYQDDDAVFSEAFLNQPCPKCGASLLTPEDLAAIRLVAAAVEYANTMVGPQPEGSKSVLLPLGFDGTGTVDLSQWPEEFQDGQQ